MRSHHLAIIALLLAGPASADGLRSASDARALIRSVGPDKALSKIYQDEEYWSRFVGGIESGDHAWCEVAIALHPALDAGAGEEVGLAVGASLKQSPKNALLILAPVFGIDAVCGGPDIDATGSDTLDEALAELELHRASLRDLRDPQLTEQKAVCLSKLSKAEEGIRRFFSAP